jgi:hypothetical protein
MKWRKILMSELAREYVPQAINNDIEADALVEQIRDMEIEYNRIELIGKNKIQSIEDDLKRRREQLDKQRFYIKAQLRAYFMTITPKATKTQAKYKLLSGELVMKKGTDQIIKDDEKLLEWVGKNAPEYVKIKESVDWAGLKPKVKIHNDAVIDENGQIVEGLGVIKKPEEFIVKID